MIILGDILARDDVQQTISQLLVHVGSPSPRSVTSRASSRHSHSSSRRSSRHHSSSHSRSRGSQSSSHGSRTGTHVIVSDPPSSVLPPVVTSLSSFEILPPASRDISPVPSASLDPPTPLVRNPASSLPTPIARPASRSSRFPNVDLSDL